MNKVTLSNMLSRPHAAKKKERELGLNITTSPLKRSEVMFFFASGNNKLNQRN